MDVTVSKGWLEQSAKEERRAQYFVRDEKGSREGAGVGGGGIERSG